MPDTNLRELILYEDIKWRDNYLMIGDDIDNQIYQRTKENSDKYLGLLITEKIIIKDPSYIIINKKKKQKMERLLQWVHKHQ